MSIIDLGRPSLAKFPGCGTFIKMPSFLHQELHRKHKSEYSLLSLGVPYLGLFLQSSEWFSSTPFNSREHFIHSSLPKPMLKVVTSRYTLFMSALGLSVYSQPDKMTDDNDVDINETKGGKTGTTTG